MFSSNGILYLHLYNNLANLLLYIKEYFHFFPHKYFCDKHIFKAWAFLFIALKNFWS